MLGAEKLPRQIGSLFGGFAAMSQIPGLELCFGYREITERQIASLPLVMRGAFQATMAKRFGVRPLTGMAFNDARCIQNPRAVNRVFANVLRYSFHCTEDRFFGIRQIAQSQQSQSLDTVAVFGP